MQPLNFMCPVLVSHPELLANVALRQNSPPVFMFVACAVVIISTAGDLEQQYSHQITWSPFNQSVFFVAVDVHGFCYVDDVSALASAVTLYAMSLQFGHSLFVVL